MKILIFDNFFFYPKSEFKLKRIRKIIEWLYICKLRGFVNKQIKRYDENLEIVILTKRKNLKIKNKQTKIEKFSEFRINIERNEFFKLKNKIIDATRRNLKIIFKNFNIVKEFNIDGLKIAHLVEFQISSFLNRLFGEFEIIIKKISSDKFNKIIILDYNPYFSNFYRYFNSNFKGLNIFKTRNYKFQNFLSKFEISIFLIRLLSFSIKSRIFNNRNTLEIQKPSNQENVLFITETENQYKSIAPIYKLINDKKEFNAILNKERDYITISQLNKIIRFLIINRRIWIQNKNIFLKNIKYDSILIGKTLDFFYKKVMKFTLLLLHIKLHHFNQVLNKFMPSLVILADEMKPNSRAYIKKCNLKKINSIFIPHAAIAVYHELISKPNFSYFTVPGKQAKDYFTSKGIKSDKIYITGRPRYDYFFKEKINKLAFIKDMFNNRVYHFDPNKFTILLTTNPVDDESNEIILTEVINSLKKLGLIKNLVVKLHPSENGIMHKKLFEKLNVKPIIVKNYDILKLIRSSDLLLSRTSTTILESMIIGTPVIILDFVNLELYYTGSYIFSEDNEIINIKNVESLYIQLEKIIKDQKFYKQYIKIIQERAKFYFHYDENSNSSQIFYNLIYDILKNR